jgi:transcriptional regulator with XRE-family HTH domain
MTHPLAPPQPTRTATQELHNALRQARRGAGLTQEELARRLGVGLRAVQRAERESIPRADLIDRWIRVCRFTLAIVLVREPSPAKPL